MGPLFLRIGPRVSQDRTFPKTNAPNQTKHPVPVPTADAVGSPCLGSSRSVSVIPDAVTLEACHSSVWSRHPLRRASLRDLLSDGARGYLKKKLTVLSPPSLSRWRWSVVGSGPCCPDGHVFLRVAFRSARHLSPKLITLQEVALPQAWKRNLMS